MSRGGLNALPPASGITGVVLNTDRYRIIRPALALAVVMLAVSACSSTPSCLKPQAYTHAKSYPGLKSPPGLQVPGPDPDMQIPNVAGGAVSAYKTAPADDESNIPIARCLSTPPPMHPSASDNATTSG